MRDQLRSFIRRLVPRGDVLEQTIMSGAWGGLLNVFSRGLQLGMLVLLANLLKPADFGLLGIGLLVLSGLRNFTTMGLDEAVIQREEDDVNRYLNTVWGLELLRGSLLAAVLLALAPVIGSVFGEPRAPDVVRVLAASPLLMALRNPAVVYFRKRLDFHREFAYQMSGSVSRFVVSVGWALVSPTVWALVFGLLASEAIKSVFSFVAHEYRPRPALDRERAAELIGYGKWLTGNSILYFLYSEGDDAVVGWLLTSTMLGFYQTAYRLSNAPATEISQVIGKVMFPAFSTLQDDPAALRMAYYRVLQTSMFVACPLAFGIVAVAEVFVPTFMGEEWLPMITAMQLLAVYGLLRSLGKTMSPLWKAIGRPDYVTKLSLLRVTLIAVLIVPVTNAYGIEGVAGLIVGIFVFPMIPLDTYLIIESIDGSYRRFVRELAYPMVASVLMYGAVTAVREELALGAGVLEFVLLVVVGIVSYVAVVVALAFKFEWGIEDNIREIVDTVG